MPFESFLGLGAATTARRPAELHDQDIEYRLDALLVGMERIRTAASPPSPAPCSSASRRLTPPSHPRVQGRFREWEEAGQVEVVGGEECYLRIKGRLA